MFICWSWDKNIFEEILTSSHRHFLSPPPSKGCMAGSQRVPCIHQVSGIHLYFPVATWIPIVCLFFFFGQTILTLNSLVSKSSPAFISKNYFFLEILGSIDYSRYSKFYSGDHVSCMPVTNWLGIIMIDFMAFSQVFGIGIIRGHKKGNN